MRASARHTRTAADAELAVGAQFEPPAALHGNAVLHESSSQRFGSLIATHELSLSSLQDRAVPRRQMRRQTGFERHEERLAEIDEGDPALVHGDLWAGATSINRKEHVGTVGFQAEFQVSPALQSCVVARGVRPRRSAATACANSASRVSPCVSPARAVMLTPSTTRSSRLRKGEGSPLGLAGAQDDVYR